MADRNSGDKIQWHQAFVGAIHCELMEDQEKLIFEQEYSITKKPLQIDLLIIKKRSDAQFGSGIGRLLSGYNILEYKSPGDALGIDELFQALTYACYYKCSAAYADERKESDITIMLIRNEYPAALIRFLEGKRCKLTEQEPGIYRVIGNTFFRLVILVTGKMDQESYLWLNSLRGDLEKSEYMNLLRRSNEIGTSEGDYSDAVLSVVELSNRDCIKWKEESAVASYLAEAKQEGISIGEKRGISIGEQNRAKATAAILSRRSRAARGCRWSRFWDLETAVQKARRGLTYDTRRVLSGWIFRRSVI